MSDWKTVKLGDVASFLKGKGLSKDEIVPNGSRECIHYGELFTKYGENIRSVISRTDLGGSLVLSEANDVLMPTSDVTPRGLSTASYISKKGVVLGGDILIVRPNPSKLYGLFFAYYVRAMKHEVIRLVSGSTVFHLYGSDLKNLHLTLPPLDEQKRIVAILEVWQDYTDKIESLINIKQEVRVGLQQELLSGKTRLSGHTSTWISTKFESLCDFQNGFAFKSSHFSNEHGVRLIRNRDLKSENNSARLYFNSTDYKESYLVKNGDILIGMDGDFLPCYWSGGRALLNQRVGRLTNFTNSSPHYLYYIAKNILKEIENETSSTTVKHLSPKQLQQRVVTIPPYQEQLAIVNILSSADEEIDLLISKKQAIESQKKYLLKNLMAGEIITASVLETLQKDAQHA